MPNTWSEYKSHIQNSTITTKKGFNKPTTKELLPDPVILFCYTFFILPSLPPASLRDNWQIIFTLRLPKTLQQVSHFPSFSYLLMISIINLLSYSLYWNDILKGKFNDILTKACFKCPLRTTHFPKSFSFYPHYQQSHLSLLKKHLAPPPLSASEVVLLCPRSVQSGFCHLISCIIIKTVFLPSQCLQCGRQIRSKSQYNIELWQT